MKIESTIKEYFSINKDIDCVYLFGSFAKHKENDFSDIDLAVLFKKDISAELHTDKCLIIMNDLSRLLDNNIDVVVLNTASSFLKFHILKSGKLMYEDPKRENHIFEARSIVEYFDFQPFRKLITEGLINNLKRA